MQYRSSGRFEDSKHDPVVVMPSPFMNRRLFIRPERTSVAIELAEYVGDPVAPFKASSRMVCTSSRTSWPTKKNSNRTKNRTTLQTMIIFKCAEMLPKIIDPPRKGKGGGCSGDDHLGHGDFAFSWERPLVRIHRRPILHDEWQIKSHNTPQPASLCSRIINSRTRKSNLALLSECRDVLLEAQSDRAVYTTSRRTRLHGQLISQRRRALVILPMGGAPK